MIKAEDQTVKATDLRIGNIANVNGIKSVIYDVMCDGVSTNDFHCMEYENVHGIPLNEEWLIKIGFEKEITGIHMEQWYLYKLDSLTLHWRNDYPEFGWVESIEVKYVHQLQNLYHSLTGTELTIKP